MMDYINYYAANGERINHTIGATRTFSNIFPSFKPFQDAWNNSIFSKQAVALTQPIPENPSNAPANLELIYQLLLSKYANSHVSSEDESRFTLDLMATVFQYGPAFIKRLEIQHTLHEMDLTSDDFLRGSAQIYNQSFNPSEDPATDVMTPLSTINQQNVNIQKRDKFKALAILEELLRTDVVSDFIYRFKPLFKHDTVLYEPTLYYETEVEPQ